MFPTENENPLRGSADHNIMHTHDTMSLSSYVRKTAPALLAILVGCWSLVACDSMIYDDEGDCSINYRVKFRYDHNLKFADAFAHEVESVTLYVLDAEGRVIWQKTEEGEALAAADYAMTVDIEPGDYDLLAWCVVQDGTSFAIPTSTVGRELTCTLNRERDTDGTAHVRKDLDRLYHGYLAGQHFADTEGTYEYIVPLVKNTNNVRVVLQHLSGAPVDEKRFTFSIEASNGRMDWNNELLPDERITYHAWLTRSGTAEVKPDPAAVPGIAAAPAAIEEPNRAVSSVSVAIAELTTARLSKGDDVRLTVKKDTGETVFSIPLVDYALLVKGRYNEAMDDQEYLDRQDEYNMTFFLDEKDQWYDAYIYIESWMVVLQNTGL